MEKETTEKTKKMMPVYSCAPEKSTWISENERITESGVRIYECLKQKQ